MKYNYGFTTLLLSGALFLTGAGCSDSGNSNAYFTSDSTEIVNGESAKLEVTLKNLDYQRLVDKQHNLEIYLYDDKLENCYKKTFKQNEISKNVITLSDIPLDSRFLVAVSRDKHDNIVAISDSTTIELLAGAVTKINELDLNESSAELNNLVASITLNNDQPLKTKVGGDVSVNAEAEFVLRNGIRIKQDLTGSSRLIWKSSNRSVLISQGNGTFRAVSPGSVKILACLGNKESEIDVIVNPVTVKTTNTETVPRGDTGNNVADLDPTLNTDPTPVVSQSSLCNLKIDLQDNVPEELNCEIRTYDENNQLRFIEKDVTDLSSLEIDRNSAVIAGVYTKANGELYSKITY